MTPSEAFCIAFGAALGIGVATYMSKVTRAIYNAIKRADK